MAHYREMEIDGETWRYNIGSTFVEIRPPGDGAKLLPKKTDINADTVAKLTPEELEENPNLSQQVTPDEIRKYIQRIRATAKA